MFFSCRHHLPRGSVILSNSGEIAAKQTPTVGLLQTLKQVLVADVLSSPKPIPPASLSLAFEPDLAPGSAPVDFVSISLPVPDIGIGPTLRSLSFAIALSLIVYSKAELQKLLRIYSNAKKSFNNKFRSTLKVCFPDLYSRKSHFNGYQFC